MGLKMWKHSPCSYHSILAKLDGNVLVIGLHFLPICHILQILCQLEMLTWGSMRNPRDICEISREQLAVERNGRKFMTHGVMKLRWILPCQIGSSHLGSFGAFCKISDVNVSIVICNAAMKQSFKVHGPLVFMLMPFHWNATNVYY